MSASAILNLQEIQLDEEDGGNAAWPITQQAYGGGGFDLRARNVPVATTVPGFGEPVAPPLAPRAPAPPPKPGLCRRLRNAWRRVKARIVDALVDEDGPAIRARRRLARYRQALCGCAAGSLVVWICWLASTADTSALGEALVRNTAPGALPWDTSGSYAAHPLTCADMLRPDERLARALNATGRLVTGQPPAPCSCATAFGARVRHIAVAGPLHMFNARLTDKGGSQTLVTESQRNLFPSRGEERVRNTRHDDIALAYEQATVDGRCESASARLTGAPAWCAQACLDLFEGISVYERAKT